MDESQHVYEHQFVDEAVVGGHEGQQFYRENGHEVQQEAIPAAQIVAPCRSQAVDQVTVLVVVTDVEVHDNLRDVRTID